MSKDLFGNEVIEIPTSKVQKSRTLFDDYDGFVQKFEAKKTTDDCYTPPEIYDLIRDYVCKIARIDPHREIVRPFYPNGDFETFDYPANCVVIDNPPFSILTKIVRFYVDRGIDFFLFAPHLTLSSVDAPICHIVVGASITYENGANVRTSFLSNLFGDIRVMGDADLYERITAKNNELKARKIPFLPSYVYPDNVLTVSDVHALVLGGVSICYAADEIKHIRTLDSQRSHKKAIFGGGYLLSNNATMRHGISKEIANRNREEARNAKTKEVIVWELSEREKKIISTLK